MGADLLHQMFKWLELTCKGFHDGEYAIDDGLIKSEFNNIQNLFSQAKNLLV